MIPPPLKTTTDPTASAGDNFGALLAGFKTTIPLPFPRCARNVLETIASIYLYDPFNDILSTAVYKAYSTDTYMRGCRTPHRNIPPAMTKSLFEYSRNIEEVMHAADVSLPGQRAYQQRVQERYDPVQLTRR